MTVYLDLVMVLNFLVDFLLLMGANRLSGCPSGIPRCCLAAAAGGVYAGVCMLPGFTFLGNTFWRIVILSSMAVMGFGLDRSAVQRGILFVFLSMALGGVAMGMNGPSSFTLILAALALAVMCLWGFRGRLRGQNFVPVELKLNGQTYRLTALCDTGNTLKDPITGHQTLIVGADVAQRAVGLTPRQLNDPIGTVASGCVSGLRLIPYRAVGRPNGMLLACSFDEVKIDGKIAGRVVAFAPDNIDSSGVYQALTGGAL